MAWLNASVIKRLREETGFTLMDCKRALEETDGDYEAAKRLLEQGGEEPDEPLPVD